MGGIGSYVRRAVGALASIGHDVHVFTFTLPADVRANVPAGLNLHECASLAARVETGELPANLAAALNAGGEGVYRLAIGQMLTSAFLEEHARQPFDVVEVPEVEALGLPLLLNEHIHVPVVTHLHCATAIAYEANNVAVGQSERLMIELEAAGIGLAENICAPTRRVVELTRRHVNSDIHATIIPYSITVSDRDFTPPPANGPVLFIGRLERLKGVELLAAALKPFLEANPEATCRLAAPDTNTGPDGRSMRAHMETVIGPKLLPRVTFLGEVSQDVLAKELATASFCVMPSLCENFSMAVCEAMASGRAVLVTEGTGLVEVVADAHLIAPATADDLAGRMTCLWRDRRELAEHSIKAKQHIATLCEPTAIGHRRVAFYQSTIDRFSTVGLNERNAKIAALPAVYRATVALAGALCGCNTNGSTSAGARLLRICDMIERKTGSRATITLYGAGKHTTKLLSEKYLWESRGHRVAGILDDHPRFSQSPVFLGLPVRSVSQAVSIAKAGETIAPVVLSTDTYEDQFWQQTAPLRELGVAVHRLYSTDDNKHD